MIVKEIKDWAISLGVAIVVAIIIKTYFFTPVLVSGPSMKPTLHNNNRMVLNKIGLILSTPKRGDIVVFHATEEKDYIKRVVGMPGDSIEYKNDQLFINGKEVDEPYLDEYKKQLSEGKLTNDFSLEDSFGLKKIPKGEYFLMGDNRRVSGDSRELGPIKKSKIIGKTSIVFWPLSEFRIVK